MKVFEIWRVTKCLNKKLEKREFLGFSIRLFGKKALTNQSITRKICECDTFFTINVDEDNKMTLEGFKRVLFLIAIKYHRKPFPKQIKSLDYLVNPTGYVPSLKRMTM